jgi:homoserine/homoserine lactone efflux protein
MAFETWFAFVVAACVIAISPGSGAVLCMSHGLNYGVKRASTTIFGLQSALVVVMIIAGAGVGSLLMASELAFNIVKTVGACYLIYLGWCQWRAPGQVREPGDVSAPLVASWRQRYVLGFLTNATNPKGIVFMAAVLPQFIDQNKSLWLQLLILIITMTTIDSIVMHGYAFAASRMQRFFKDAKAVKRQNQLFGTLLMCVGAGLFFFKRSA